MREIKHIVIHCSASRNGDASVNAQVIDRWHRERGWHGIGYHYVIQVDGTLAKGRPLERIGAHVAGQNATSIGICMVGTDRFSVEQWEMLRDLCHGLQAEFPRADILGHRDFSPDQDGDGVIEPWEWFKLCPGFDVAAWRLSGMDPYWDVKHLMPDPMAAAVEQHGFGTVHAVAAVAGLGIATALFFGAKAWVDGVREDALKAGRDEALLEVTQRDNAQLAAVQKRVLELQAELGAAEDRHRAEVARIDQEGTDELRKLEKERDAARRAARDYAGRLRDPGARQAHACPPAGDRDAAPAARTRAGVDPGAARPEAPGAELSQAAGEFLRAEADRADELVAERNTLAVRLEACQAIVIADRRP